MELGRTMLLHSAVISIAVYFSLLYALGNSQVQSENRALLVGAFALVYMILFGHQFPPKRMLSV
jgi:hypothetical protein